MKTLKTSRKPIQIYLDAGQDTLLELLSKKRGVSKASIIREGVYKFLKELPIEEDPAMELINLGGSGKRDISAKHDQYLVGNACFGKK